MHVDSDTRLASQAERLKASDRRGNPLKAGFAGTCSIGWESAREHGVVICNWEETFDLVVGREIPELGWVCEDDAVRRAIGAEASSSGAGFARPKELCLEWTSDFEVPVWRLVDRGVVKESIDSISSSSRLRSSKLRLSSSSDWDSSGSCDILGILEIATLACGSLVLNDRVLKVKWRSTLYSPAFIHPVRVWWTGQRDQWANGPSYAQTLAAPCSVNRSVTPRSKARCHLVGKQTGSTMPQYAQPLVATWFVNKSTSPRSEARCRLVGKQTGNTMPQYAQLLVATWFANKSTSPRSEARCRLVGKRISHSASYKRVPPLVAN